MESWPYLSSLDPCIVAGKLVSCFGSGYQAGLKQQRQPLNIILRVHPDPMVQYEKYLIEESKQHDLLSGYPRESHSGSLRTSPVPTATPMCSPAMTVSTLIKQLRYHVICQGFLAATSLGSSSTLLENRFVETVILYVPHRKQ